MKLVTFEFSDRSIAVTTLTKVGEQWECKLSASRDAIDESASLVTHQHMLLDGVHCADAVLEKAIDFSTAFLQLMI